MAPLPPLNLSSYRAQLALRALAERLRSSRRLRGLTQTEAARLAGVRVSTYRRLESGDGSVPTRDFFKALSGLGPDPEMITTCSGVTHSTAGRNQTESAGI